MRDCVIFFAKKKHTHKMGVKKSTQPLNSEIWFSCFHWLVEQALSCATNAARKITENKFDSRLFLEKFFQTPNSYSQFLKDFWESFTN